MFTERKRSPFAVRPVFVSNQRTLQREQTRLRLLSAARDEFEERGFDAATLRSIAARVGVAVGTVFVHFTDKRDLLHATLFADLEEVLDATLRAIPSSKPVLAQLEHVAFSLFQYYEDRPALSRALLRESLFAEDPWRSQFQAQVARAHAEVRIILARGVERSQLASATPVDNLAGSFLANYYFALIAWVQRASSDDGHRVMFRQLMAGQLKPWSESQPASSAQPAAARRKRGVASPVARSTKVSKTTQQKPRRNQ